MNKLQKKLLELKKLRDTQAEAFKALKAKEDPTADELKAVSDRNVEIKSVQAEVDSLQAIFTMEEENDGALKSFKTAGDSVPTPSGGDGSSVKHAEVKALARVSKSASLKNFKGNDADVLAYKFARWYMATLLGDVKSAQFCRDHDIPMIKAQVESSNTLGGYTVPPEFSPTIIDLRESFGVLEANIRHEPMARDTKTILRRKGGLQVFVVGEGKAIGFSEKEWNVVKLTAEKRGTIALISSELNEDSTVNLGDDLAGEVGYAFALHRDDCGFNGDGTSAFGGIVGLRNRLRNPENAAALPNVANVAGLIVASANNWGGIVLKDFSKMKGKLPRYASQRGKVKWFCHQEFWAEVMEPLALAAGGALAADILRGTEPRFLGYDVEITQILPKDSASGEIPVCLGNPLLAGTMGDRRQMTLSISTEFQWAQDMTAIKGTERFDVNWHDVGNVSAVAKDRQAGPMVALITQ